MFRGKNYKESAKLIDKQAQYEPQEAFELITKTAKAKFDETVELHVKLGVDSRHADQQVRGAIVLPNGTGKIEITGSLGDVMKESAQAALSCLRSRADALGIEKDFYKTKDIHVHFPEGAVPKDGPSAGITMATAMLSAITKTPVRADVAMTGEITLRGRVLPIGGLKEKTLAAKNAGIKTICVPKKNEKDIDEISPEIKKGLKIVFVEQMKDVLDVAFVKK